MNKYVAWFWKILLITVMVLFTAWPAPARDQLVSNVFDNTYIVDALRDISAQTGVPIIADATVNGQITLAFEKVSLEDALERVLAPGGYVYRKLNGFYLVGAPDSKNPSFPLLSETAVVKLHYAKAENIIHSLADSFAAYVKADKDNNALVITAPAKILQRIKSDLVLIDRPARQVMLEALVVEVSKNGRKDLGLDWWQWDKKWTPQTGDPTSDMAQIRDFGLNIARIPDDGLNAFLISLKISVENGNARIEANPRVAAIDGQSAEIFVGKERYYYLTSETDKAGNSISSTLESIKSGITLKMLPQIADNGDITVKIEPEVSDVTTDGDRGSASGNGLPVISSRKVSTMARVKDGESIVLGGLIQRNKLKVRTKIPFLGDIPIIGFFFSRTKTIQEENEVLVIITPKIIDNGAVLDEETKTRMEIGAKP